MFALCCSAACEEWYFVSLYVMRILCGNDNRTVVSTRVEQYIRFHAKQRLELSVVCFFFCLVFSKQCSQAEMFWHKSKS